MYCSIRKIDGGGSAWYKGYKRPIVACLELQLQCVRQSPAALCTLSPAALWTPVLATYVFMAWLWHIAGHIAGHIPGDIYPAATYLAATYRLDKPSHVWPPAGTGICTFTRISHALVTPLSGYLRTSTAHVQIFVNIVCLYKHKPWHKLAWSGKTLVLINISASS